MFFLESSFIYGTLKRYISTVTPGKWKFQGVSSKSIAHGMIRLSRASEYQRSRRAVHFRTRITRGLSSTTSTTSSMGLCISTTSRPRPTKRIDQGAVSDHFQSTERISQDVIGGESQRQRYVRYPVTLLGLRVNMTHGKQSTYSINPHPR